MGLIYNQWCIDTTAFPLAGGTSAGILAALDRQSVPYTVFDGDVRNVPSRAFFWGSLTDAYDRSSPQGYLGHGDSNNFRCSVYRDKWSHFFKGRAGEASFSTVECGVPRSLQHEKRLFCRPLPILFEPVALVGREWRFVVVDHILVTGCQYAGSRVRDDEAVALDNKAIELIMDLAHDPWQPARAYVVDVAEMNGVVSLLEINPISGADFYGCNPDAIVWFIMGMEEQ